MDVTSSQKDLSCLHAHNLAPRVDVLEDLQGPAALEKGSLQYYQAALLRHEEQVHNTKHDVY